MTDLVLSGYSAGICAAVLLLVYASLSDLATLRIPNFLSVALAGVGLVLASLRAVAAGDPLLLLWDVLAALVVFRVLFLLWQLPALPSCSPTEIRWPDARIARAFLLLARAMGEAFVLYGRPLVDVLRARLGLAPVAWSAPRPVPAEEGTIFGGADVKMLTAASLAVGVQGLMTLFVVTALAGGVVGLLYLLVRFILRRPGRPVAYGPAIAAGTIIALLGHGIGA